MYRKEEKKNKSNLGTFLKVPCHLLMLLRLNLQLTLLKDEAKMHKISNQFMYF